MGRQEAGEGRELPLSKADELLPRVDTCFRMADSLLFLFPPVGSCRTANSSCPSSCHGIPSPDGQPQCGVAVCFWVCAGSGLEGSQDSPSPWSPPHTVCCILCELRSL